MIRLSLAVLLLLLAIFFFKDMEQVALYILSAAMFLTGTIGYCGLYAPFGARTCSVDDEPSATVDLKIVLMALLGIVVMGFYFGTVSLPKSL